MKKLFLLLFLLPTIIAGQVVDDFSDGNFTLNPSWKGDTSQFKISTYTGSGWSQQPRLQLNGSSSDTSSLFTVSAMNSLANKEWNFWIRLAFNTSKQNNCRIYLVSDSPNLHGSLHGYYVMLGDDNNDQLDSISLWKQDGIIVQRIIAGHNTFTGASGNYRIKVIRDNLGVWSLYVDPNGGNSYILEGNNLDNSFNTSSYFGLFCKYTTTNKTYFYFDDIYAGNVIIDSISPEVVSVHAMSSTNIDVLFSENIMTSNAENLNNYQISGLGNPIIALKDLGNPSMVHLTFQNVLLEGVNYSIDISGINDIAGNQMVPGTFSFTYYNARIFDVVINELMADPDPPVGLPNYEYLELKNNTPYQIYLKNWTLTINSNIMTFSDISILPNGYLLVADDIAYNALSVFGPITVYSTFSLTNTGASIFLKDQNEKVIHYILYSDNWYRDTGKDDGGWSLEQIDPYNPCGEANNWMASASIMGGTPGAQNSVYTQNPDISPPEIINVKIINPNKIELLLNEIIMKGNGINPLNFYIDNGIGTPSSAILIEPENKKIILQLSVPLQENILYTLSYNDSIFDCSGNYAVNIMKPFVLYKVKPYDIIINEIMADPDPVVGLPNLEYLELYNKTDFPVGLSGWKLDFSGTKKTFPDVTIDPKGYMLVSGLGSKPILNQYGPVAEISGFSLTNSGQVLELLDTMQHCISQVNYSETWYDNNSKDDGGWALERIDPKNSCGEKENWKASIDPSGGTPGKINSVFGNNPDTKLPVMYRASVSRWEPHRVTLYFDEALDSVTMKDIDKYYVDNGIGNPYLIKLSYPDNRKVTLMFSEILQQKTIYTITVWDSVFDCSGNKMAEGSQARFAVPVVADSADLVINEILSNPKDDGVDYVEIYNRSEKVLDGIDLTLSATNENKRISFDNYLIFPGDYVLLTTDADKVKEGYFTTNPYGFITMESFPGFNNDNGSVILRTNDETIIDEMAYDADMHFYLLSTTDGVSLERIDYNRPASDRTNWHSASETVGFGTPAYKNSQFIQGNADDGAFWVSPEIFSPDNDGYNDVLLISCKTEGPGKLLNITIYDAKGRLIKYLVRNKYVSGENAFSWDGINEGHQKANVGIYMVYAQLTDINGKATHYRKTTVLATKF